MCHFGCHHLCYVASMLPEHPALCYRRSGRNTIDCFMVLVFYRGDTDLGFAAAQRTHISVEMQTAYAALELRTVETVSIGAVVRGLTGGWQNNSHADKQCLRQSRSSVTVETPVGQAPANSRRQVQPAQFTAIVASESVMTLSHLGHQLRSILRHGQIL